MKLLLHLERSWESRSKTTRRRCTNIEIEVGEGIARRNIVWTTVTGFIVEYVWLDYPKILGKSLEKFRSELVECSNLYTPESFYRCHSRLYLYIRSGHVHFHKAERYKGHLATEMKYTQVSNVNMKETFLERTGDWKPIHSRRAQSWSRG